ncbi:MAG TPA: tRNA threonylcarbamoyladenosine dehydratase [Spirochaetia bacterium]|nr:tRNA threonylcarbamoyladenosine dehydratase [Spirochaetia bacterium]
MREEWVRTAWLIGEEALELLAASRVAVFGLGGVGSFCVEGLARAGVGGLLLVDRDVFEPSNINRQLTALTDTIGRPKAEVMAERVSRINPDAQLTWLVETYTPENGHLFFQEKLDYVVDAMDDVPAKVDLIKRALNLGIPVVASMGAGNRLDPTRFKVADISATHGCPLARVVRKKLREEGIAQGVKVAFSDEPPSRAMPGTKPGSISFVPPVAGFTLASVVVRDLIGRG